MNTKIEPFGERGIIARLGGYDDPVESGILANACADRCRMNPNVTDAIAGIDSLVVLFNRRDFDLKHESKALSEVIATTQKPVDGAGRRHDIPVHYGGEDGPDLEDVAALCNMKPGDVVELHAAKSYRVITLGFAPGFAYLGKLDKQLHTSRLATPRTRISAGSVGIADDFTCVYPLPSPGGWRLIGRTSAILFDPQAPKPFLFKSGDTVRFTPRTNE